MSLLSLIFISKARAGYAKMQQNYMYNESIHKR